MPNTHQHIALPFRARRQPVNHSGSSLKKISSWPWCPFSTTWEASHRAYRGNELKLSPWKDMEKHGKILVLIRFFAGAFRVIRCQKMLRFCVAEHICQITDCPTVRVAALWFSQPSVPTTILHVNYTIWNRPRLPSKIKHLKQILSVDLWNL